MSWAHRLIAHRIAILCHSSTCSLYVMSQKRATIMLSLFTPNIIILEFLFGIYQHSMKIVSPSLLTYGVTLCIVWWVKKRHHSPHIVLPLLCEIFIIDQYLVKIWITVWCLSFYWLTMYNYVPQISKITKWHHSVNFHNMKHSPAFSLSNHFDAFLDDILQLSACR